MKIIRRVNSQRRSKNSELDQCYRAKSTPESNTLEKQPTAEKQHLVKSYRRLALYISIIITMLISGVVSIVVALNMTAKESNDGDKVYFPNEISKTNFATEGYLILDKEKWGGKSATSFIKPLHHPTKYVFIGHTVGRFCKHFDDCSSIVKRIQEIHNDKSLPDIKYNFLIGGDGNIYTGRGWDFRNEDKDNSIAISFLGDYRKHELTQKMVSALEYLLGVGVESKKLSENYILLCHNQTVETDSPGENVYKVVSTLPNFCPGSIDIE